jgi:hypothetical protein
MTEFILAPPLSYGSEAYPPICTHPIGSSDCPNCRRQCTAIEVKRQLYSNWEQYWALFSPWPPVPQQSPRTVSALMND